MIDSENVVMLDDIYAHINHENGKKQTLEEHSKKASELAACYARVLSLPHTAELIGLIHDIGKATTEFQRYIKENDKSQRGKINHSACGGRFISEQFSLHTNDFRALAGEIISAVIVSHHQGLIDLINVRGEDTLREKLNPQKETFYAEAVNNAFSDNKKIIALFNEAVSEIAVLHSKICALVKQIKQKSHSSGDDKFSSKIAGDFMFGLVTRFMLSCLLDADRYDTACFMDGVDAELPLSFEELWARLVRKLDDELDAISPKNTIDEARANISRACRDATGHSRGIFQLSVPTGAGKTFSGLRFALHNAAKYNKDRIFYIAPFKTILEQNASVIRSQLECDTSILEHHSDVVIDDENEESTDAYKLHTERWDSPIILTTMVQFLNTLFLGKNRSVRRFHNLANSVIIIDEAQSLPMEMTHMLTLTLNFLAYECNTIVLLCTATQPDFFNVKYPLLTDENAQLTPDIDDIFVKFKRVEVIDKTQDLFDVQKLTDFITSLLSEHRHILTILNTKKAAGEAAKSVVAANQAVKVIYITTNLCPAHRHKIIEDIKRYPRDEPLVCVATSLVEAGVDFSFDCVVRSLAGLDSVAQAAGRCNRGNENPKGGKVYIIYYKDENTSRLKSIMAGQESSKTLLYQFGENPARFGYDLISRVAMDEYYSRHFASSKELLDFSVDKKSHSELFEDVKLLDLLSSNPIAIREWNKKHDFQYPLSQSFRLAGEIFRVIDDDGNEGILVPYGDGVEYIEQLRKSDLPPKQVYAITRKAQRYSVSIHKQTLQKLQGLHVVELLTCGVYLLDKRYYNDVYGVVTDGQPMDLLEC